MDSERTESRRDKSEERYHDTPPIEDPGNDDKKSKEPSRHRTKDGRKSRKEEKDHRSRDKDRSKPNEDLKERDTEARDLEKERVSSREKRKDEKEEHEKYRGRDRYKEKDHDLDKQRDHDRDVDKRGRGKERELDGEKETDKKESERGREKDRGREKNRDRDKDKEREKEKRDRLKDKSKDKERERHSDRDKERELERDEREKGKEKSRGKERDLDGEKDKPIDREKTGRRIRDDGHDRRKDVAKEGRDTRTTEVARQRRSPSEEEDGMIIEQEDHVRSSSGGANQSVEDRILKMREERLQRKSEGASEISSWVNKLGKLEERRKAEKQKALLRSKMFEEQDKYDDEDNEDGVADKLKAGGLAGAKILHGLDKVVEGGSVVLTLKDQDILANGDINEDVDMLENVEIGEQRQRDDAYKAAKKKTGTFADKFNDEAASEKKMLPQYDDPATEEGVTLDASGRFSAEAEKKLEELRLRLKGPTVNSQVEDLTTFGRVASDYYTAEEMLKFKKPKKKKSLRKREKLDVDSLEAEAIASGLGAADLGSRSDASRQAAKEEQERSEAEKRNSAYQAAFAKAEEASQALRMEQTLSTRQEDIDDEYFADDAEDYQRSLDRVRKVALIKQKEEPSSGPEAIARLAAAKTDTKPTDDQSEEPLENKVVITEMEEFIQGLHVEEEVAKPGVEDFFMEEDGATKYLEEERGEDDGGLADTEGYEKHEMPENVDEADVVADETIHEQPVGKGVAGALKLLKERGALKETVEWGGRNMDKKKSKLVGIYDEGAEKEIRIERTDEFGRILTPKEAFRLISHKFHGKGPGKMKQEKRQKQYYDELKLKQMKNSDTPSESVERMKEAQARMGTPFLILSGNVKPGQTSDPASGFATVERNLPGSLTPMLGDRKVEHFLGIKRKAEAGNSGIPKKPKT